MQALELKLPPLALAVLVGAVMALAARAAPALDVPFPAQRLVVLALAAAGVGVVLAGVHAFRRARTTVDPMHPERSATLVAGGIYRRSRNPMSLGFLLLLAAWACWLANLLALAGLPAFVLYLNRFQIVPEERALRERFGDAYDGYARAVRRWL
jgi:protein-S-isoprenylcysteine O-methyltransferase Ste14